MPIVAPSILSADFSALGEAVTMIDRSEADWVHIDVMDGRFVPNISFGMPVIRDIRSLTKKPFDVHLMIVEPEKYIGAFRKAGADYLTVHYEVSPHLHRTVQAIKESGMKAGVAINPSTPVHVLEDILPEVDIVCLMSVNPGFGGQKFIGASLEKITRLKELITATHSQALIEVDGGVGEDNAQETLEAGADIMVAGNSVFSSDKPIDVIGRLKQLKAHTVDR